MVYAFSSTSVLISSIIVKVCIIHLYLHLLATALLAIINLHLTAHAVCFETTKQRQQHCEEGSSLTVIVLLLLLLLRSDGQTLEGEDSDHSILFISIYLYIPNIKDATHDHTSISARDNEEPTLLL